MTTPQIELLSVWEQIGQEIASVLQIPCKLAVRSSSCGCCLTFVIKQVQIVIYRVRVSKNHAVQYKRPAITPPFVRIKMSNFHLICLRGVCSSTRAIVFRCTCLSSGTEDLYSCGKTDKNLQVFELTHWTWLIKIKCLSKMYVNAREKYRVV